MANIILLVHLLIALAIIGLILLQQGKGAEMGSSFGAGASQTLFGATGSGNFFAKFTAILVTAFFATSIALAVLAKSQSSVTEDLALPELIESEVPVLNTDTAPAEEDLPVLPEQDDLPSAPAE